MGRQSGTASAQEPALTAADMQGSHRQILRSSSIIGGASVANIVIGLLRTKIAALLLGPAGVGFIALLQSLVSTGSAIAGLGVASSSVRQLAEAGGAEDANAMDSNRQSLLYLTAALAVAGAAAFWLLRVPLAEHVLGDAALSEMVGWLGLAVAFTLLGASQVALLNGYRRIGDMARVSVFGALLGTLLGIAALVLWGKEGILPYVISAPLAAMIVGAVIVRRMPSAERVRASLAEVRRRSVPMLKLGLSFMVAGVSTTGAFLAVRAIISQRLGAVALGHFSAAWMISMTYIGFVLQAMGTDYYPRLTAAFHDRRLVNRMVNEQSDVALLLAAPVLIGMQAAAPWVIHLLYSSKFDGAVDILRWQIMGDALKILSWPLGFVIVACGKGRIFVMTETLAVAVYLAFVWGGIGPLGLVSTGVGFLVMYVVYLPVVYWIARRITGFRWNSTTSRMAIALVCAVVATGLAGRVSHWLGLACGLPLAIAAGVFALVRLSTLGALGTSPAIARRVTAIRQVWAESPPRSPLP